jgi:cystathionine gamma-synthase/methionine-gamma-lyase
VQGYVYGRYGTPTTAALELALAELDGTAAATCFVSGMAAIAAFVDACAVASGGRIVAQEDIYGQVRALFERWIRERGAKIVFVDATDHRRVEAALKESPTTLLYIEAMANPLLRITDIGALAQARPRERRDARGGRDVRLARPAATRGARRRRGDPFAHEVRQRARGRHGGSVAGSAEVAKAMRDPHDPRRRVPAPARGVALHPWHADARAARAPAVRERGCASRSISRVTRRSRACVIPAPVASRNMRSRRRQFGGLFGGVVTFDLKDATKAAAFRFLDALELAASATTLGDLFSEVLYPAISSHRRVAPRSAPDLASTRGRCASRSASRTPTTSSRTSTEHSQRSSPTDEFCLPPASKWQRVMKTPLEAT